MKQFTEEQAKRFYESGVWKTWSKEQIARFQLYQDILCVPFKVYHEAIENELGRPVWTHEFAFPNLLRQELEGKRNKPTFEEILCLIPAEKRMVIFMEKEDPAQN